jgi:hypothetical protein
MMRVWYVFEFALFPGSVWALLAVALVVAARPVGGDIRWAWGATRVAAVQALCFVASLGIAIFLDLPALDHIGVASTTARCSAAAGVVTATVLLGISPRCRRGKESLAGTSDTAYRSGVPSRRIPGNSKRTGGLVLAGLLVVTIGGVASAPMGCASILPVRIRSNAGLAWHILGVGEEPSPRGTNATAIDVSWDTYYAARAKEELYRRGQAMGFDVALVLEVGTSGSPSKRAILELLVPLGTCARDLEPVARQLARWASSPIQEVASVARELQRDGPSDPHGMCGRSRRR